MFLLTNWTDTLICQTVIREKKLEGSQCSHWLQNYLPSCRKNSLHSSVWNLAANGKLRCKQNFPWQLSMHETLNSGKDWKPRRSQQLLMYEGSQSGISLFSLSGNSSPKLCWDVVVTNSFLLYPKPYMQFSTLFSMAFTFTLQIPSFCFSALKRYGCIVTLTAPFSTPMLWSLVVLAAPILVCCQDPAYRDPSTSSLLLSAPKRHFKIPLSTEQLKYQPHKVLHPQIPCTIHAFNCSPEVHSCQTAACYSVISGPMHWKTVIYLYICISELQWVHMGPDMTWWSSPTPEDAGFQQCGQSGPAGTGRAGSSPSTAHKDCADTSVTGLMLSSRKASWWTFLHCMQRRRCIQARSSAALAVVAQSSRM